MKNFITVVIWICVAIFSTRTFAQNDSLSFRKTEFGFNSVPFITNLLPFDEPISATSSDVLLLYKRKLGIKNTFFRSGIQVRYVSEGVSSDDVLLNLRLGVEKKKYLSKRWVFHSGGELFTSLMSPELGDLDRGEFGVAGLLGFQWLINERMGLGTEGYITLSYVEDKSSEAADIEGFSSGIVLPRTLFFSVYF